MTTMSIAQFATNLLAPSLGFATENVARVTLHADRVVIHHTHGYTTYHQPAHQEWEAQDGVGAEYYTPSQNGCDCLDALWQMGLPPQTLFRAA